MKAALPVNEIARLQALADLEILDTLGEASLDDVVKIAAIICAAPVALISLVDTQRQWFKACLGMETQETPRDIAFCAHAILQPEKLLIVEDAQLDNRFSDNPLVTDKPGIRFYAGAPLVTAEGFALGTLCVLDYKPRILDSAQQTGLAALARQVIQLFQLRSANQKLQRDADTLQFMSDNLPVLIGQLDQERRYVFCNNKYREWYGIAPENMLGKTPQEILGAEIAGAISDRMDRCYAGDTIRYELSLQGGQVLDVTYVPRKKADRVIGMFVVAADITHQKKLQREIEHKRENLDMVIRGTNIGTWQWNVQTGATIFNERWAEIVGYSLDELAPVSIDTWMNLAHPDDLQKSAELLQKHFSGELDYYDCKCRMKHKEGHWVWVHDRGSVADFTVDGKPQWMFGTHADINELQTYQVRLQESEERLHSMLSNFPGAVYRCGDSSRQKMIYLSQAVEPLVGYAAEEFLQPYTRSFADLTHPDDRISIDNKVKDSVREKRPFDLVYRLRHAKGDWRWVAEMGTGIYDDHARLKFVDGFIWDITAAEESRKEIHMREQQLSSLYNLSPVAISVNRFEDGQFIQGNPELFRMTGYSEEEFSSLTYWDITPSHYAAEEQQQLESLHTAGRYGPYEKHYIHKTGHLIPVLLNGVMIEDATGERQIWSIIQDITERKRIEQIKNEFVSAVSHELRTPLTSISGALKLVASGALDQMPDKLKVMLDIAYKNSERLTLLINDLLDMEKLLAGKMIFVLQLQPLRPLLERAVYENKAYADQYQVVFHLREVDADVNVRVDEQRFLQVMANLLSNAAKFSPAGAAVEIDAALLADQVRIVVIDRGPGIPLEFQQRIFQKFSQADSSDSRQKGGTGLGLAITKEILEHMGGEISFTSLPGEGAQFYIDLPTQ